MDDNAVIEWLANASDEDIKRISSYSKKDIEKLKKKKELAEYQREADAGYKLYKFMRDWFAKYPSSSLPVKSLAQYEKRIGLDKLKGDK